MQLVGRSSRQNGARIGWRVVFWLMGSIHWQGPNVAARVERQAVATCSGKRDPFGPWPLGNGALRLGYESFQLPIIFKLSS